MRKTGCSVCLLVLLCLVARAQSSDAPTVEIYGGYSNLSKNTMHGWNASVARNANRWVGVVADFSGHYKNERTSTAFGQLESRDRMYTFLFGPRFSVRENDAVTPFVHVLLGVTRSKTRVRFSGAPFDFPGFPGPDIAASRSVSSFAWAAGGGLDVKLSDRVALRAIQIEYLQAHFFEARQKRARTSAGLVVRF